MAYFKDLSVYSYSGEKKAENVRNIGWLDKRFDYSSGKVSSEVIKIIEIMLKNPQNIYRGKHPCNLCAPPNDVRPLCSSGTGEIRVMGSDGIIYAAPTLILHYIIEHQYAPPDEFLKAVLQQG
ncbi:hypothetical protein MNBD_GAMMA09-3855 [hydrothermal vent metagenome]|uniref:DUF7919 domain-containing protein n=1 Tax=hydrothermal vent metagenome TaxID=652676 RepID=A0A3B0X048_9ZZZZ